MDLRKKQIKNALSLVFLSQGVPMLYAGDEMCNSQKGNNNPYCLDNEISWTNWNKTAMAKEITAKAMATMEPAIPTAAASGAMSSKTLSSTTTAMPKKT